MDYDKYLKLQSFLEWFYEFHPQFFDGILPEQKKLLQDTFLYDAPDEGYPKSLQDFYDETIGCKPALQHDILAAESLCKAGVESLFDDFTALNLRRSVIGSVFFSSYLSVLSDEITFCISISISVMLKFLPKL